MKLEPENAVPKSAMAIFAHPDDPEFSCAGTVARWTQAGCRVTYVLLTSGNVGTDDASLTPERLTEIREAEQRAACAEVGVHEVVFLRHGDCQLVPTLELRRQIVQLVRQYRPDVVLTTDPTGVFWGDRYINHPDHRAAGQATIDAVAPAASQVLLWPELGKSHRVCMVYLASAVEPNVAVDISETIGRKIAALRQHKSQMGDWDPEQRIRERAVENGKDLGMAYAERFRRMTINEPEQPEKPEDAGMVSARASDTAAAQGAAGGAEQGEEAKG